MRQRVVFRSNCFGLISHLNDATSCDHRRQFCETKLFSYIVVVAHFKEMTTAVLRSKNEEPHTDIYRKIQNETEK